MSTTRRKGLDTKGIFLGKKNKKLVFQHVWMKTETETFQSGLSVILCSCLQNTKNSKSLILTITFRTGDKLLFSSPEDDFVMTERN